MCVCMFKCVTCVCAHECHECVLKGVTCVCHGREIPEGRIASTTTDFCFIVEGIRNYNLCVTCTQHPDRISKAKLVFNSHLQ